MKFRVVVKIGVIFSALLFCIAVALYSFAKLNEAGKGKDINLLSFVPEDCYGVLETDNIDYFTNEYPQMAYAIDLDTLHHSDLINSILTELTQYTSVNSHGISNQMQRMVLSFHNVDNTEKGNKNVVAYFKISNDAKKFLVSIINDKYGSAFDVKKEDYRGRSIEIYPLGKSSRFLSVLSGDGYIIVSYHKRLIEKVIDAIKDDRSLMDDAVFASIPQKKSANFMTLYSHSAPFPALTGEHHHVWSEFELHMNSDVLYLSGAMYEPDSCRSGFISRLQKIGTRSEDRFLVASGNDSVDYYINKAINSSHGRIFDECVSNLSRDASYIMVADMEKVAESPHSYRDFFPEFLCENVDLFRPFVVSLQLTEVNGNLSHIYVFTYKS